MNRLVLFELYEIKSLLHKKTATYSVRLLENTLSHRTASYGNRYLERLICHKQGMDG